MTAEVAQAGARVRSGGGGAGIRLAVALALRDLRGGVSGFRVFLACLGLGVAMVAAVLSVSRALEEGVAAEGRFILGGDATASVIHRQAADAERGFLDGLGRVAETATLRAMARGGKGLPALVELKAVDGRYPLYGTIATEPRVALGEALEHRDGLHGAVVAPELMARLKLRIGDRLSIGDASYAVRAALVSEPDRLSGGLAFGPRVLLSVAGLEASGLIQPGSLVRWTYKLALDRETSAAAREAGIERLRERLVPEGYEIRTSSRAAPGVDRFAERMTLFLSLIGLTALVVGGVGVANATAAHLDQKASVIATLKCLGAPGRLVFSVYLVEIMILAGIGIVLGLVVGGGLPLLLAGTLGEALPLPTRFALYPEPLIFAAASGALTALMFALWPLGRAQEIPPAALFRAIVAPPGIVPRRPVLIATAVAVIALAVLIVAGADDQRFAAIYVAGAAASFAALIGLGRGVMWAMRRAPRPRGAALRLGLANLARPGAATPGVILSLGLGLTLLVMVGLIDANLERQLSAELPAKAPSFFFLDIQKDRLEAFDSLLAETRGIESVNRVPMLRGRIVALGDVPADEVKPESDGWVLRGDRGITYSNGPPDGTRIVTGEWWPADYSGPQLVSFAHEPAVGLGLTVGDRITVNVLGRDVEATIASTRDVNWRSLGINFVMVFSPGPIEQAPHAYLATVTMDSEDEPRLVEAVAAAFPDITVLRVKDALEAVSELLEKVMTAIRAGGAVAILTGALVLGGAIAAGRRTRVYDAVVLKTFGVTRPRIMGAFLAEFAVLGLVTALFASLAGSLAAYFVLTEAMNVDFVIVPTVVAGIVVVAVATTLVVGFLGTWRALGAKAAPLLRSP